MLKAQVTGVVVPLDQIIQFYNTHLRLRNESNPNGITSHYYMLGIFSNIPDQILRDGVNTECKGSPSPSKFPTPTLKRSSMSRSTCTPQSAGMSFRAICCQSRPTPGRVSMCTTALASLVPNSVRSAALRRDIYIIHMETEESSR